MTKYLSLTVLGQIVAMTLFVVPSGIIYSAIVGILASVAFGVLAGWKGETTARRVGGVVAGIISLIGWGSWLVVALTTEPSDPVINITGLLVFPGLAISLLVILVNPQNRFRSTHGWVFAILAFVAASGSFVSVSAWANNSSHQGFEALMWGASLLGVIAAAGLLLVAATAETNRLAARIGVAGGVLALVLYVTLFYQSFGALILVVAGVAATVVERKW